MAGAHIKTLLGVLEYPGAQTFSTKDAPEFRRVVFSLEDKFVCLLQNSPPGDPLRSSQEYEGLPFSIEQTFFSIILQIRARKKEDRETLKEESSNWNAEFQKASF